MASASANNGSSDDVTDRLLTGMMDGFPGWDITHMFEEAGNDPSPRNRSLFSNFLASLRATSDIAICISTTNERPPPRVSPESSKNSSITCRWCDVNASKRCLECNEFMCSSCVREHGKSPICTNQSIVQLPTPIGTSPTSGMSSSVPTMTSSKYVCDQHNEMLCFVCDFCRKVVCQCCTLHEHKEHPYSSIQNFVRESDDRIGHALQSSGLGKKCIKTSIDRALAFIRHVERNCAELSDNIRKAFRQFITTIEDREHFLLDFVEKLKQRRLAMLYDQMAGLKSTLAGLSETSEMLNRVAEYSSRMDDIDIAMKVTNGQRQLEQFAAIYKDLQPKQEVFAFAAPDYGMLQDIRNLGGIVLVDEKNIPIVNITGGAIVGAPVAAAEPMGSMLAQGGNGHSNGILAPNIRRPLLRDNSFRNVSSVVTVSLVPTPGGGAGAGAGSGNPNGIGTSRSIPNPSLDWELNAARNSPGLHFGAPRSTPAIPGSAEPVSVRNSSSIGLSFATEGHEDGQVSRPWGLCVDKCGHILVSDRRNNRVQVFNPDGMLKFKFGRKGVGNGEFDLPAGICVDIDNRIIVVDKDNHRVQIFTSSGAFLLKFGSYGKEYGQFQYPWDVAVNSRRQIVVTDSRNHRIQQFDSEGRFIRQIVFDNHGSNKGIASPRGVCYTPTGNIIVSDFDNHCLYLIDPDINEILAAKGHEGSGIHEFNRPSGICCDDDGRIIVADSKNQRIIVYSATLEYLWDVEIRPSLNRRMPKSFDEKDRTCDVALTPDGCIAFLIELSPDSKEGSNPYKRFVHVFQQTTYPTK